MSKVSAAELHEPTNDPSTLTISPGVPLTETQRRHVAIVLDIFQAKGTMAKFDDNFTQDAVYEDLFASAKDRQEVGVYLQAPTSSFLGLTSGVS